MTLSSQNFTWLHHLIRIMPAEEEVTTPMVQIANLSLAYDQEIIFSNINLHVAPGSWIGLLGPSGVGKSSFIRLLAGLKIPLERSQGSIHTDNHIPLTHQIAYMAQTDLLLPWLNVWDNAVLGIKMREHTRDELKLAIEKAKGLLDKVGLGSSIKLYPHQLSGGMRQRVALVRTLMEDKPILLMDEPFSALDAITRYKLQDLAVDLLQNKTVLFITHDPAEALRLADEIYLLHGRPAQLKQIARLSSVKPRELNNPEITALQSHLFQQLSQADSNGESK